jgi:hypothetical protein
MIDTFERAAFGPQYLALLERCVNTQKRIRLRRQGLPAMVREKPATDDEMAEIHAILESAMLRISIPSQQMKAAAGPFGPVLATCLQQILAASPLNPLNQEPSS